MSGFKVGDRVQVVDPERWLQPWRKRFHAGRKGTVLAVNPRPMVIRSEVEIEWDHGKTKYPHEWKMILRPEEIKLVEGDQ